MLSANAPPDAGGLSPEAEGKGKMMNIGIIGSDNSHCLRIATLCNVDKAVACRVAVVCGETVKSARERAEQGVIPTVVRDWREMLGQVDGVMIDHRHAREHYAPAKFFLENGVPVFVDKPFTFTLAEGRRLCALAREKGVALTSFSIRVFQQSFQDLARKVKKLGAVSHFTSSGPCDIRSKHGGVFFYGIHQVDPMIELFGLEPATAFLQRNGVHGVATIIYRDGPTVTINCVNPQAGPYAFCASVVGKKEMLEYTFGRDENPYLCGTRLFTRMFRTGKEPIPHERFLATIAVLEALAKSLKTGKPVRVARVTSD